MFFTKYLQQIAVVLVLVMPMSLCADELTLNENAPKSYIVKKGDTLWDISGIFLKQPWLWPKLWRLNPEVSNPHLIYPGEELRLVFDEKGEPMLVKGKPELKWSPKVREQLKEQEPISTIPLHLIAPYIKYDSVATEEELESAPYVLSNSGGYQFSDVNLSLFVKGDLAIGKSYAIYHKGDEIIDPENGDSLGFHLILVATAKATATGNIDENIPSTLHVDNAKQEIQMGDYVMPINDKLLLPATFIMKAVSDSTEGHIIKSLANARAFGRLEIIMINLGLEDSVNAGSVLSVQRTPPGVVETSDGPVIYENASMWARLTSSEDASDFKMPQENVGEIMVFRAYEKVSFALILRSNQPLLLDDTVGAP